MVHDVIATCPVCSDGLTITRLHCRSCGTALEGEFGVGRFGRLDSEQMRLLESFLRSRGNLKEMERELGISYPTVRGRVDGLVRALGLADGGSVSPALADDDAGNETGDDSGGDARVGGTGPENSAQVRRDILEQLARKEISAEDAAARLRTLAGGAG